MTTHGAWYNAFLPKNYNDGRPIESSQFDAIARELVKQFGGLTEFKEPSFPMQGSWMGLGLLQTEDVFIYGVFATDVNAARAFFDEAIEPWKAVEMLDSRSPPCNGGYGRSSFEVIASPSQNDHSAVVS